MTRIATLLNLLAVLALATIIVAPKACAQDQWIPQAIDHDYAGGFYSDANRHARLLRHHRYRKAYRVYRRHREATRVYAYERRRDDDDDRRQDRRGLCLHTTVDVVSTEHTSEENAREAARKLMMAKVQWAYGGQYMNIDEAADVKWRCGPSNAHDTFSSRLSEAAGKLTGREGQNVRCALWIRPCRAERESAGNGRRR